MEPHNGSQATARAVIPPLDVAATLAADVSYSTGKNLVLSKSFTVPLTGKATVIVSGNLTLNNGSYDGSIELNGIAGSEKQFSNHAHSATPRILELGRVEYSGLTAGASLTAEFHITPITGTIVCNAVSSSAANHLTLMVKS